MKRKLSELGDDEGGGGAGGEVENGNGKVAVMPEAAGNGPEAAGAAAPAVRSVAGPAKSSLQRPQRRRRKGKSRTVQIMEDYVSFVGRMVYPELARSHEGAPVGDDDGDAPLFVSERITPLGVVTLPLRRQLCIERWSPFEVAKFEGSMCIHGKNFHAVQKDVQTKSTKDIIEFYYLWKKTSHYKLWKRSYENEEALYANSSGGSDAENS
uniref:SANT domain-containing protein n=1 Tax=Phaeomonas parva TaxID=124430 RepID=A0A7S1UJW4_9STRA|mmetsp:Transcript_5883/g.16468  ORF Transcript_5883/g.16468 Transcript_5883/m.16468 type:complete len:210 (+) Transcript_5883:109-738(+)|eukprot:CAMPEP_0118851650 /NCGR_PEP_ID=MMETSP1163-20130328/1016_1 /TAXON_ID=124430 /ORGANISM="Phaeomonas parva, Strain CCMP2877" /LENGTH=209 /DNA_ID=CAMNT_0006784025 /DNA_START=101 /DNA_END=730 /DNA_ORIENTATION=+